MSAGHPPHGAHRPPRRRRPHVTLAKTADRTSCTVLPNSGARPQTLESSYRSYLLPSHFFHTLLFMEIFKCLRSNGVSRLACARISSVYIVRSNIKEDWVTWTTFTTLEFLFSKPFFVFFKCNLM